MAAGTAYLMSTDINSEDNIEKRKPKPDGCELCGRPVRLTFHHLIPKKVHRRKRMQKRYSRQMMRCHGIWICRLCHTAIHEFIPDEQELADEFCSLEQLQNHPPIARHITWACRQKS